MVKAGDGYRFHVTGLTHDERGYPSMNVETQDRLVRRLQDKLKPLANGRALFEAENLDDAEVVVVSYGITSRVAQRALQLARAQGVRAGKFRIISAWPFPEQHIRELAGRVKAFVVPELNLGQMVHEVERAAAGRAKVIPCQPRRRQRAQSRSDSEGHSGGSPMSEARSKFRRDPATRTTRSSRSCAWTACRTSGVPAAASAPRSTASPARW